LWPCEKLRCLLYEYFNHITFTYIGVHKLDADALSDCFEFERIEKAKDLARSVFFFSVCFARWRAITPLVTVYMVHGEGYIPPGYVHVRCIADRLCGNSKLLNCCPLVKLSPS
jgi:hypothetical protein